MTTRQRELVRGEIWRHIAMARVTSGAIADGHIEVAEALRACLCAEGRCGECECRHSTKKSGLSRALRSVKSLLGAAAKSFRAK